MKCYSSFPVELTDDTERFSGEFEASSPSSVPTAATCRPDPHNVLHPKHNDGHNFLWDKAKSVELTLRREGIVCSVGLQQIKLYLPGYTRHSLSYFWTLWWWRRPKVWDMRRPGGIWKRYENRNCFCYSKWCHCFSFNREATWRSVWLSQLWK